MKREEVQNIIRDIKSNVESILNDKERYTVCTQTVKKNNEVELEALVIMDKQQRDGLNVSPTLYLDDVVYDIYDGDITTYQAAEIIVREYYKISDSDRQFKKKIEECMKREYILSHVYPVVVNSDMNQHLTCECPYREFMDMLVIYRVFLESDSVGNIPSFIVKYGLLDNYDISEDELKTRADENLFNQEVSILDVDKFLKDHGYADIKEHVKMLVISNASMSYGANVILKLHKILGEYTNAIIIPSSIHELIAICDISFGLNYSDKMRQMIEEVNSSELNPAEVLNNHAYLYNGSKGECELL